MRSYRALFLATSIALVLAAPALGAQEIVVGPYVQQVGPTTAWVMWETDVEAASQVEFGPTDALGSTATGIEFGTAAGTRIQEVGLVGLEPGSEIFYRVRTGDTVSETSTFRTLELPDGEQNVRMVALSDMQVDSQNRGKFGEIITQGVIPWFVGEFGGPIHDVVQAVVIPGDLVDSGGDHNEWVEDFWGGGGALFGQVPVYPVFGNHEGNTPFFRDYFHLPDSGASENMREHWWSWDVSNVRLVGLDSNDLFALVPEQMEWFDTVLEQSCADDMIDFVFVQLHHPHRSELWPVGESGFSLQVSDKLGEFATRCQKVTALLFGHTHGYSRGTSPQHPHFMINVATGGGNIDYWGEYLQVDYDEMAVSDDEYGFVVLDMTAGDDPSVAFTRVSMGDEFNPTGPRVTDTVGWRARNAAPEAPTVVGPIGTGVAAECATLALAPFVDTDGDTLVATQWQVAATCDGFDEPLWDRVVQDRNVFGEVDLNQGVDLTQQLVEGLGADGEFCWRARFRDSGFLWSEWSIPRRFSTVAAVASPNLLVNPRADERLDGWDNVVGEPGVSRSGECAAALSDTEPFFALGGSCGGQTEGAIRQVVPVAGYAAEIDAGTARFDLRVEVQTPLDRGEVSVQVTFVAADGRETIGPALEGLTGLWWTPSRLTGAIPPGTRGVAVEVTGAGPTRPIHTYVDNLSLTVGAAPDCTSPGSGDDGSVSPGDDTGVDAGDDAGLDAGSGGDADPDAGTDGGVDGSATGSPSDTGCTSASPGPVWPMPFGVVLAAVAGRRRRGAR